ncbi:MAG: outer membrane beta-barrel protein [bacterium]
MKAILFGLVILLAATPASAQVGYPPAESPYTDLEYKQELTPMFGYTRARVDAAGILPRSAPMAGLRYEIYLAGPVSFSTDFSHTFAQRNVIDPTKPARTRSLGTEPASVNSLDIALALGLTGRKSWHSIVPQIRAGLGIMQSAAKDSSGYKFGTPFAFHFGGGLKFVPGGRFQLRADVTERLFKQSYPDSYARLASDNTAVIDDRTPRTFYTHHTALTVGVSYRFAR